MLLIVQKIQYSTGTYPVNIPSNDPSTTREVFGAYPVSISCAGLFYLFSVFYFKWILMYASSPAMFLYLNVSAAFFLIIDNEMYVY